MPSASPPRLLIQAAHSCAFSGTRSTQTTVAPSSASPWAMPAPMLGLVPVTMATFPASFIAAGLRLGPRLLLEVPHRHATQRHLVRRHAVGGSGLGRGAAHAPVAWPPQT